VSAVPPDPPGHAATAHPPTAIAPTEIVGRAAELYRDQAGTLIAAALIVFSVEFLLALIAPSLLFLPLLLAIIVGTFYQGMVVNLVRDLQDGRRDSSLGELFAAVRPVVLPLLGVSILSGIGIGIGFVLLIVPGLFLLTIWSVAAPVCVVERPGVIASLARSRELVRGRGWAVFGTIALAFIVTILVSAVFAAIASPLGDVGGDAVRALGSALTAPFSALTAAVLYFTLAQR
jgi:hypothetical protein